MSIIFIILVFLLSVVVHELAHGYAALKLGDPTALHAGRLTLNPIKHIDPIGSIVVPLLFATPVLFGGSSFIIGWAKPVPFNPYNLRAGRWGEAIVAFAGPLSNIVIALIFTLVLRAGGIGIGGGFADIVGYIILINLVLACFNLIPIPPLDGSKILFSILPLPLLYKYRAMLESYGMILVLLMIFLVWPIIFPFILKLFGLLTGIAF